MAEIEQIAGISIGIAADLEQLEASLSAGSAKVTSWADRQKNRKIVLKATVHIEDDAIKLARRELLTATTELQKGLAKVPVRLDFGVNRTTINRLTRDLIDQNRKALEKGGGIKAPVTLEVANAEGISKQIKDSMGKTPVPVSAEGAWAGWKGDVIPTVPINVVGHFVEWDGDGGPTGTGGGTPTKPRRGGGAPRGAPEAEEAAPAPTPTRRRTQKAAAKETGEAVADAISDKTVKVEPSKKQETKAKTERRDAERVAAIRGEAASPQVADLPAEIAAAAAAGGEVEFDNGTISVPRRAARRPAEREAAIRGEAQAAPAGETDWLAVKKANDEKAQKEGAQRVRAGKGGIPPEVRAMGIAEEPLAATPAGAGTRPPIGESARFTQGGEPVIECNQCHQIVPIKSWPAHRGVHTRRANQASRESEEIGRKAQADVTLHRRGFGDVEREPERAEAIGEFEFAHGMGAPEEMAARNKAWAAVKAALEAGANPQALLEQAKIIPEAGSESKLQAFLGSDEGSAFASQLAEGLKARRGTGARTGALTTAEQKAQQLSEQGFGLGAALMRAGVAEGIPQDLFGGRRRRPIGGAPDEAAGRLYEADVMLQARASAQELDEARRNVKSGTFSKRNPDIVAASNAAIDRARAAMEMPFVKESDDPEAAAERRGAIAGAIRGSAEEPGLSEVADALRKTYSTTGRKGLRSYRRLITGRRKTRTERDLAVEQIQSHIQALLEEQRGTSGRERQTAEIAETARETAEEFPQGRPVPITPRQERARRLTRGPTGGLASLNPALVTEATVTRTTGPRGRLEELPDLEPELPLEATPPEMREYSVVLDAFEVRPEDEIVTCPLCGANVRKAEMDDGRHFDSLPHKQAAAGTMRGGPREFAGGAYNPEFEGAPLPLGAYGRAMPGPGGPRAFAASAKTCPICGSGFFDDDAVARHQEKAHKAGSARTAAPVKTTTPLRVKDLTPDEQVKFREAQKRLKEIGQPPATPEEFRQVRAAKPEVTIEPEPQIVTQEAVAPIAAAPPPITSAEGNRHCDVCNKTIKAAYWGVHEKSAGHQNRLAKIEPATGQVADVSSEKDKAALAAKLKAADASDEEIAQLTGTSARQRGTGPSSKTKFCDVCQKNVRAEGHETSAGHLNALATQAAPAPAAAGPAGPTETEKKAAAFATPSLLKAKLGPVRYDEIARQSREELTRIQDAVQDVNQFSREVLEENPVRAFAVALSQVVVNLTGRARLKTTIGDINRQARDTGALAKDAKGAWQQHQAAVEAVAAAPEDEKKELQASADGLEAIAKAASTAFEKAYGAPLAEVERIEAIPRRADREAAKRKQEEAALAKEASQEEPATLLGKRELLAQARPGLLMRTIGISSGTLLAGALAYQAAMAAINVAMQFGAEYIGRVTDEMTGFAESANKLASSLGQASLATGRIPPPIAAQLGQAGIGGIVGARIAASLEPRVAGEAAALRIQTARDTLALNAQTTRDRLLHPEIRNFAGVFQPTGGMVLPLIGQTNIGAQPSVQETVAGMLSKQPSNTGWDFLTGDAPGLDFIRGLQDPEKQVRVQADRAAARDTLDTLTRYVKQGGGTAQFRNPTIQEVTGDRRAQQIALAGMGASPDFIARVASGDVAITDATGKILTNSKEIAAVWDQFVAGMKPALDQVLKAMERPLVAQMFALREQTKRQIEVLNPIQRMQQQALQPIQPFGTGLVPMRGAGPFTIPSFAGAPPAATAAFGQFAPQAREIQAQIHMNAAKGWEQFVKEVRGSPIIDDPEQVIGQMAQVRDLGAGLAKQQRDLANMNVAFQWEQYNVQVFRARRNIGDLAAMVKNSNGVEASHLGILNAENLALDRQMTRLGRRSQALSLEMSQRQINFQLAVSQFSAAGATPAEAAANRKQAELEAAFAQEQLDIQQEMFGLQGTQIENQIQIVDEANLRAFQDALVDFNQFQEGFRQQQIAQALSGLGADIATLQGQLLDDVNANVGAVNQVAQSLISAQASAFEQGAEGLKATAEEVVKTYTEVFRLLREEMGLPITGKGGGTPKKTVPSQVPGSSNFAGGMLGTFNTPTSATFGEAGNETVAILRNPRNLLLGAGGGGGTSYSFSFTFTGAMNVREDSDIQKVAREVVVQLNKETRLLGFGR